MGGRSPVRDDPALLAHRAREGPDGGDSTDPQAQFGGAKAEQSDPGAPLDKPSTAAAPSLPLAFGKGGGADAKPSGAASKSHLGESKTPPAEQERPKGSQPAPKLAERFERPLFFALDEPVSALSSPNKKVPLRVEGGSFVISKMELLDLGANLHCAPFDFRTDAGRIFGHENQRERARTCRGVQG